MVYGHVVGLLFVLLMVPALASAVTSPRAEIETFFERAKTILGDAVDVDDARAQFGRLTRGLFEGRASARHALGAEWDRRSGAEREQFARTFAVVFERAYLEIVQGQLPTSRVPDVRVLGEDASSGRRTVVRTSVTTRDGSDVRMDYVMARMGERWRVHDVLIDGVSVVDNYRDQFARVLRTASYPELLERLRVVAASSPNASRSSRGAEH
jgi:phospholipid transport system substrate-binding protein